MLHLVKTSRDFVGFPLEFSCSVIRSGSATHVVMEEDEHLIFLWKLGVVWLKEEK